jgi:hypothetical protein
MGQQSQSHHVFRIDDEETDQGRSRHAALFVRPYIWWKSGEFRHCLGRCSFFFSARPLTTDIKETVSEMIMAGMTGWVKVNRPNCL